MYVPEMYDGIRICGWDKPDLDLPGDHEQHGMPYWTTITYPSVEAAEAAIPFLASAMERPLKFAVIEPLGEVDQYGRPERLAYHYYEPVMGERSIRKVMTHILLRRDLAFWAEARLVCWTFVVLTVLSMLVSALYSLLP